MTASFALIIFAETLVALFVIWGFMHEEKFIRFERRVSARIARIRRARAKKRAAARLRVVKGSRRMPKHGSTAA